MMNRGDFALSSAAASIVAVLPRESAAAERAPAFRFQSLFWQNLHHTLYYQSQVLETVYGAGMAKLAPMDRFTYADLQRAAAANAHAWYGALRTYHDHYASLNFVFSDMMIDADNALARDSGARPPAAIPSQMRAALESAAPVYHSTLWPAHNASNRSFIAKTRTNLARHGAEFVTRLARIYRTPWLTEPYVVDVVQYADSESSYGNYAAKFFHIVLSAQDPTGSGMAGLDTLFHEASHSVVGPRYGTIGSAITREANARNRPEPDQFWHTVIMYTPGKLAEEIAARDGGKYTMLWMAPNLFGADWRRYYQALERHWFPYMRGEGTLDLALSRCVDEIAGV